jgi:hypothetical protein
MLKLIPFFAIVITVLSGKKKLFQNYNEKSYFTFNIMSLSFR